jgi:glycine dehydrogenase subunit 1
MAYLPHTSLDNEQMLKTIGVKSFSEIIADVPLAVQKKADFNVPKLVEADLIRKASELASKNISTTQVKSYLGAGSYEHFIPSVVNALASRGEFMTSYTPYQPEVSQGTLRVIYEFQSMICELTNMEIANASLYDGASAAGEAAILATSHTGKNKILIHSAVHPEYQKVIQTYCHSRNIATEVFNELGTLTEVAGVIVQNPNFYGEILSLEDLVSKTHAAGALFIQIFNPIALGICKTPGNINADIAVAEGQPLGIPHEWGGPYVGLFACKDEFKRLIPGRVVGKTVDRSGKPAYVLTLQTREQHIRREKATSNICTNQGLMALRATLYMSTIGRQGLVEVAEHCFSKTEYLKTELSKIKDLKIESKNTFHEFVITLPVDAKSVIVEMLNEKIFAGVDLGLWNKPKQLLVCVTETKTKIDLDQYVVAMKKVLEKKAVYAKASV